MSTTYIKKSCKECGYTVSKAIYGYIKEPFGVPFAQCPCCGTIAQDKEHMEWIQMSKVKKFFAILPRGFVYALGITVVLTAVACRCLESFISVLFSSLLLGIISMLGISLLIYYVIARYAVNSMRFVSLYKQSVKRTRNRNYRELLEGVGPLYDEKLPYGIKFSKYYQDIIDYELNTASEDEEINIPSLDNSIIEA